MLVFFLGPDPALWGQEPKPPLNHPKAQNLLEISLGTLPEYTRLIFTFARPLTTYEVRRVEVNEMWLDFGPSRTKRQGRLDLSDDMVAGVVTAYEGDHLVARVKLTLARFTFRHFTTPDRLSVILDLKSEIKVEAPKVRKEEGPLLALPSPQTLAKALRRRLPSKPEPGADLALLATAMDYLIEGNFRSAADSLELFKSTYPASPRLEEALYMMGEAYFHINPADLSAYFLKITSSYQQALDEFPGSPLAPRARIMMGRAFLSQDYPSEAADSFKSVDPADPESVESLVAKVYLAEVYLKLGRRQLAEAAFEEVLAKNPRGNFVLDGYSKLGESYFQDGLYSRANEVFREVLAKNEEFYQGHPEI
ncbi:MAG: tetratricopeptide repeat protein, partial [Thermodesulfobacteriota bacterium]